MTGRRVFISYGSAERVSAAALVGVLNGIGEVDAWFDRDRIEGGDGIVSRINAGLQEASAVLALFGAHPRGSWAMRELDAALYMELNRSPAEPYTVVPVVVPGHPLDGAGRPDQSRWPPLLRSHRYVDFRLGFDDHQAVHELRDALEGEPQALPSGPTQPPYPGLRAFEPFEADVFFGRTQEIADLRERLRTSRIVIVVGASGSGKSSLVNAGLVPRLATMPGPGGPWSARTIRIRDPHGLRVRPSDASLDTSTAWADPARDIGATPLLVVDQLEDLFIADDRALAEEWIAQLARIITGPGESRVVVTMRSDFLGEAASYTQLRDLLNESQYVLGPLTRDGLREAIEGPANAAGLTFQPGVVTRILRDCGDRPGLLPLLNETLRSLWELRQGTTLTLGAYEEQLGGLSGALEARAERVWSELEPDETAIARAILLRLAVPRGVSDATASHARPLDGLVAAADAVAVRGVVEAFVAARLLQVTGDANQQMVDVAHDALFDAWPRLRGWLEADPRDRPLQAALEHDATDWNEHDRDESFLYRGSQLSEATGLSERRADLLSETEVAFLDAGQQVEDNRRAEAIRHAARDRTRSIVAVLLVLGIAVAAIAAVVSLKARRAADRARAETQSLRLAAEADRLAPAERDSALLLAAEAAHRSQAVEPLGTLVDALATAPLAQRESRPKSEEPVVVAGTPNGSAVLVGRTDGTVEVLDPRSGKATSSWDVSTRPLIALHGTAAGAVLTLDDAGTISRTDPTGATTFVDTLVDRVTGFDVDPNTDAIVAAIGRAVVVRSEANTTNQWQLGSVDEEGGKRPPLVAFSADGQSVAIVDGRRLLLGDRSAQSDQPKLLGELPAAGTATTLDPTSNTLAVGDENGTVTLVDLSSGAVRPVRVSVPRGGVFSLAFAPDGLLAGANELGEIVAWDLSRSTVSLGPVSSRPSAAWADDSGAKRASVTGLVFADSERLFAVGGNAVVRWELRPGFGLEVERWRAAQDITDLAATEKGEPLAVEGGTIVQGHTPRPDLGTNVDLVAWSTRGPVVATADGTVKRGSRIVATLHDEPLSLASDDRGGVLIVATDRRAWVIAEGVHELHLADASRLRAVAAAPDGQWLAAAADDRDGTPVVTVWRRDGDRFVQVRKLEGHRLRVDAVAFDGHGQLLTGSDDRTVRVVRLDDGKLVQTLTRHGDGVIDLAVRGSHLWTSTQNGEVHSWLWVGNRYQPVGAPILVSGTRVQVATSGPDRVLVATRDTVRSWRVAEPALVGAACDLAGRALSSKELDRLELDKEMACRARNRK